MGFRNMAQFNISLLAKQGWMIINNQNSLVAQVFKAKYLPNDHFLNSRLGNSSSYVWKSIWTAKGILEKGLCWRVGTGLNISINDDAWISDAVNFRLSTVINSIHDFKVNELIDSNARLWKMELIKNTFSEDDAGRILRIPLTRTPHDDFLIWGATLRVNSQYALPINNYKVLMKILKLMLYKPFIGNFTKSFGS
ncbi:reverse transcriptase [Gossypium australe]|uniref:Reverse transcriptase n=1 Tax=Gossypium australe TaxID=47621 RepID=A0A5B6W666_9ROSI|nr:reverse transcriptase [Gossypium australe]